MHHQNSYHEPKFSQVNAYYSLGVDVGGTFTDCVLYNEKTAKTRIRKILSTPKDPSIGVFKGIDLLLKEADIWMGEVSRVIHGTTLVSNAVIERKGARVGMITTQGFINVLDMRREWRYDNYDFHIKFPKPLVPKHLRREVKERVWYNGDVLTPLDEHGVIAAARELIEDCGVESIAICFLHSYAQKNHEEKAKNLIQAKFPDIFVTTSSEITPYVREYERFSTTAINAYALPLIESYLNEMEKGLKERGLGEPFLFFVTSCSGGLVSSGVARSLPVLLLESGPAAGVRIASHIGGRMELSSILSFDMGGTTAKGCIIKNGLAEKAYEFEVARIHRFKAGSGYPVIIPSVHLMEMGAGGGSIAMLDSRHVLRVGPWSSGAEPGPACYSRGGIEATVTDADLLLGYLNPDYFLGGKIRLDPRKAESVIRDKIANPLDLPLEKAAFGIYEVVSQNMSQAFRIHAAERGVDVRQFDVFAFGGAGPVHAWKVAENLYSSRVVVPFEAGMASARGLLVTPLAFNLVHTRRMNLEELTPKRFKEIFNDLIEEKVNLLELAGVPIDTIMVSKSIDMRYRGQGFNVEVELPKDFYTKSQSLRDLFEEEYKRMYSLTVEDVPIEVYNFKALVTGPDYEIKLDTIPKMGCQDPLKGQREAYFGEDSGFIECSVYDRYGLQPGTNIYGPSIVEEVTSTSVIPPGAKASIDRYLNIIIDLGRF